MVESQEGLKQNTNRFPGLPLIIFFFVESQEGLKLVQEEVVLKKE